MCPATHYQKRPYKTKLNKVAEHKRILRVTKKGLVKFLLVGCIASSLLAGCTSVGPEMIRSGRLTYNEAIAETNSQQMLMAIIHNRYAEESHLLSVASVTANVRVRMGATVEAGFGDIENYSGNLVPFRANAVYEENPTISYVPVGGQQYLSQVASPVPIKAFAQLTSTLADPTLVYASLLVSVNGIYNPDFLMPSSLPDPRFEQFVKIMVELNRAHRLHWIEDSPGAGQFSIVINDYAMAYAAQVDELLKLLGVADDEKSSRAIVLPVSLALSVREAGAIGITTRSVYRLMEILSASVALSPRDQDNGSSVSYPLLGPVGQRLRIHFSENRPGRADVAVQYRDGWYYIDERDQATKQFFRLLSALWSVSIEESAGKASAAPVLTVPVSR